MDHHDLPHKFYIAFASRTRRAGDFPERELDNTSLAFAKAGQLDAQLFAALAQAARRRVSECNLQKLDRKGRHLQPDLSDEGELVQDAKACQQGVGICN